MINWTKKINWKKTLLAALAFAVIAFVVRMVEAMLTMDYYVMPEYFSVWSKVMMPEPGPPPPSFTILSLVFSFITGLALAIFYFFVREVLPKDTKKKVAYFSAMLIGLGFVFCALPLYLLVNLPLMLLVIWFISGAVIDILAAVMFVKLLDR